MSEEKSELLKNKVFLKQTFQLISSLDYSVKTNDYSDIYYKIKQLTTVLHMLEIEDCGSIGGFSENQDSTKNIVKRLDFLLRKNNIDTIKVKSQIERLKRKSIIE